MKKIRQIILAAILGLSSFALISKFAGGGLDTYKEVHAATQDTIVDTLTLSDLTIGGKHKAKIGHSDSERKASATFDFSAENTNKNLVFQFKFEVLDDTASESIQTMICFDVADDVTTDRKNTLYFNGVNTKFARDSGGWSYANLDPVPLGMHEIEYGRIALLDGGVPTGSYYVYYKLDGVVVRSNNSVYDVDKMDGQMYLYYSSGNTSNTIYDINYDPDNTDVYETPKVISVSDLKRGGKPIGHTLAISEDTDLTYDNSDHRDHYSLVFKFKYEVGESKQNQFHLSCTGSYTDDEDSGQYKWASASSAILNNNGSVHLGKSYLNKVNYGWHNLTYAMSVGTTYDIEFGRKAKMDHGVFLGTYHIYLKINGEFIKEDDRDIPQPVLEGNLVFISHGGDNTIHDADYVASYDIAINSVDSFMKLGFTFDQSGDTYSNVKTMFGVGIEKEISSALVPVAYTYGIEVKTSSKTVNYESASLESDATLYYKLINLGDVINNKSRATDVFNVRAYIDVNGLRYYSTSVKSYSVDTIIDYYLGLGGLTEAQTNALNALKEAIG